MGNTDKFEMIANIYDTSERIQIAKVSSNAIREYLVDTKNKNAIDFGDKGTKVTRGRGCCQHSNSRIFLGEGRIFMARQARKKSATSMYHIMMRGMNRQNIFEDQDDYTRFLETLSQYKKICGYR